MYKIELACYCEYVHQEMEIVTGFTTKGCNAIGYHPTCFLNLFIVVYFPKMENSMKGCNIQMPD